MGNWRLFTKSVAIVLAMAIGLTLSPLKLSADSIDTEQQHSTGNQSSTNTGLIIGGVAAAGLLVYFILIRDHSHKTTTSTGEAYTLGSQISLSDKEHTNNSLFLDHESPFFLSAQRDLK
ncbi:MAG: hypothetical protein HKK67_04735 [Chlorobiaceae bacterium]|nr:hypothetical protein [Chlorobiaceae bacterium]